jgi:uncharacterized protein (TIGR03437 family)
MRVRLRFAGAAVLAAGAMAGQTAIVQNAAGGQAGTISAFGNPFVLSIPLVAPAPSNVVAPGMLAMLSAPATKIGIRPSGSATPIPAELTGSTSGQATFVVPRNMPLGGAEIEYQAEGQPTGWTNVNVVAASFDFFRIAPGGPVIAQAAGAGGALSPIGLATPAQPGQTIVFKGSGLGNALFTVTVGGVPAPLVAAAPHRANPGADEIRIQIPAAAPDGCYVPLVLTYNGTAVNTTISKTSNGAACASVSTFGGGYEDTR